MALTFDPFREMDRMTARLLTGGGAQRSAAWMPMDLYRVGEHYVVHVDLPGVDPGSIDLDVDATTLTIQAEKAPMSIVPSMPMLTTPERSHITPHSAPKANGVAARRMNGAMAGTSSTMYPTSWKRRPMTGME